MVKSGSKITKPKSDIKAGKKDGKKNGSDKKKTPKDGVVKEKSAKKKPEKKRVATMSSDAAAGYDSEEKDEKYDDDDEDDDVDLVPVEEMMALMIRAKKVTFDLMRTGVFPRYQEDNLFVKNPDSQDASLDFWFNKESPGYLSFNAFITAEDSVENLRFYNYVILLEEYAGMFSDPAIDGNHISDLDDSGKYIYYVAFYRTWEVCYVNFVATGSAEEINLASRLRTSLEDMSIRVENAGRVIYEHFSPPEPPKESKSKSKSKKSSSPKPPKKSKPKPKPKK